MLNEFMSDAQVTSMNGWHRMWFRRHCEKCRDQGLVAAVVHVHPDDVSAVLDHADHINAARGIEGATFRPGKLAAEHEAWKRARGAA